jgi:hypothetical protein
MRETAKGWTWRRVFIAARRIADSQTAIRKPLTYVAQADTIFVWGDLTRLEAVCPAAVFCLFLFLRGLAKLSFLQAPSDGLSQIVLGLITLDRQNRATREAPFGRRCGLHGQWSS